MNNLDSVWIGGTATYAVFLFTAIMLPAYRSTRVMNLPTLLRLGCGWSAFANGIFHVGICIYMFQIGNNLEYPADSNVKDLSFTGPYSDPGFQVKNILAIPIAILFLCWGHWIINLDSKTKGKRKYLLPIIFLFLGWINPAVYPAFFQNDQHEWPLSFVFFWVGIFWSETMSALFAIGYMLLGREEDGEYSSME